MSGRLAIAALNAISGALIHGGGAAVKGAKRSQVIKAGIRGGIAHGIGGYVAASFGGSVYNSVRAAGHGRILSGLSGSYIYGKAATVAVPVAYVGVQAAEKMAISVAKSRTVKAIASSRASTSIKKNAKKAARRGPVVIQKTARDLSAIARKAAATRKANLGF